MSDLKSIIAWCRDHCPDIRGDVAADAIEALQAEVAKQAAALKVAKIALLELHYSNSTDIAEALYQKAIRQINELGVE